MIHRRVVMVLLLLWLGDGARALPSEQHCTVLGYPGVICFDYPNKSVYYFPDVTGDGFLDFCLWNTTGIRCSQSYEPIPGAELIEFMPPGGTDLRSEFFKGSNGWKDEIYHRTIQYPDINGDGKSDVCGRGQLVVACGLSDGVQFVAVRSWTDYFSDSNGWLPINPYLSVSFPDLNGDGKADICAPSNFVSGSFSLHCGLSDGTKFVNVSKWSDDITDPEYLPFNGISFPDLDGDSRADYCLYHKSHDTIWCAKSDGVSRFSSLTQWVSRGVLGVDGRGKNSTITTLQFADLNGDKNEDFCIRGESGLWCGLSDKNQFTDTTLWSNFYSDHRGFSEPTFYATIQFPDVNGDHKADVCGQYVEGVYCEVSDGHQFTTPGLVSVVYKMLVPAANGGPPFFRFAWLSIQFPDLNGDGKAEVCVVTTNEGMGCTRLVPALACIGVRDLKCLPWVPYE